MGHSTHTYTHAAYEVHTYAQAQCVCVLGVLASKPDAWWTTEGFTGKQQYSQRPLWRTRTQTHTHWWGQQLQLNMHLKLTVFTQTHRHKYSLGTCSKCCSRSCTSGSVHVHCKANMTVCDAFSSSSLRVWWGKHLLFNLLMHGVDPLTFDLFTEGFSWQLSHINS